MSSTPPPEAKPDADTSAPEAHPDPDTSAPEEDPVLTRQQQQQRVARDVPYGLTVAAAWSWRLVVVLIVIGAAIWLLSHVSILLIPLIIAGLLATLLSPVHKKFISWGVPAGLSVAVIIIGFLALVAGLLFLVGQQLASGFGDMRDQVVSGVQGILVSLERNFGVTADQWNNILDNLNQAVRNNSRQILSGALGFGSTAGNIAAGTVLAIFALIFFLYDGKRIWRWSLNFVPRRHRKAIDGAGMVGWKSLGSYVRVQIFVAFVDALGIGAGAWFLNVPLAVPLGVLVFFGSFVPIVGAFLTGAVAVVLALVANGVGNALAMLAIVLLVQQIEGNVLQPLVMGRAVSLHPLAVFLAVSGGTAVLGLVGAVFAVPLLAFLNSTVQYFHAKPWLDDDEERVTLPRETTFRERAAELEGPWGRAFVKIDGVVRRTAGEVATGTGSTTTDRRSLRRALKRSKSASRRRAGGRRQGTDDESTSRGSGTGGNVRADAGAGEDNTGMDRSGRRPDQDGGRQ